MEFGWVGRPNGDASAGQPGEEEEDGDEGFTSGGLKGVIRGEGLVYLFDIGHLLLVGRRRRPRAFVCMSL
jgi:hypothetical protein